MNRIRPVLSIEKKLSRLATVSYPFYFFQVHQWECSAETVTEDLLRQFFKTFENQPEPKTICNFYGSTEMSDVTYESFSSIEEVEEKIYENKVPIGMRTI